jgi:hypothetical protein
MKKFRKIFALGVITLGLAAGGFQTSTEAYACPSTQLCEDPGDGGNVMVGQYYASQSPANPCIRRITCGKAQTKVNCKPRGSQMTINVCA